MTPYVIALLVMVPLSALLSWLDSWIAHDLAFRLLAEMRVALYRLLDPLAPAYLMRRRSGDLVSTATGDIELIELFYAHTISPAFQALIIPAVVLVVLGFIALPLAFVLLPFLLAVSLTPLLGAKRMEALGGELRGQTGQMSAHMVDSVQGLRTIAAFNYGERRRDEVVANGAGLAVLKQRFLAHQSFEQQVVEVLIALGGLAVFAAGAALVLDGKMARLDLPLVTLLAVYSFAPVVNIVTVGKELMQTVAATRRYFAVQDEPVAVQDGPGVSLPATTKGLPVRFEDVTFRYNPGDAPALEHADFELGAGQTVAVVGRSGSGKSTAAHLLLRFWDPQSGRILIDGRDIKDFELDELRKHIGLVAQDTYLFNTSLWENLKLGKPDATDGEVREAARLANVEEFIDALPEGYETIVGERGAQLSGGQRQRVAIARALLKDAPILVLDEATSHLDAVNEAEVRQALDRLMEGTHHDGHRPPPLHRARRRPHRRARRWPHHRAGHPRRAPGPRWPLQPSRRQPASRRHGRRRQARRRARIGLGSRRRWWRPQPRRSLALRPPSCRPHAPSMVRGEASYVAATFRSPGGWGSGVRPTTLRSDAWLQAPDLS